MTATSFDISPSRFRLKKIARRVAVGLGRKLRFPNAQFEGSVRVLTYHRFGFSSLDPFCLEPPAFAEQLDWLGEHSSVLTPGQFDAVMSGAMEAPANAVLISIDDGHESVAMHALPALDARGLKAVLFVCPGLVETDRIAPEGHGGFMDWRSLADAAAGGHVIATHGHSHRSLGRLPLPEAIADIDLAIDALESKLGVRSLFFAFPFGTRADYSNELVLALAARGLRYCFTSMHGCCFPNSGTVLLPRIKIEGGNEEDLFPHIARGAMDHWRFVDHALYHLQQRGRM